MNEFFVTVGGRRLTPLVDLETTKSQLVQAVRSGGDFVDLAAGDRIVEVLVTPSTPVSIDPRRHDPAPPPEQAAAGAATMESIFPSFDDYDQYGT